MTPFDLRTSGLRAPGLGQPSVFSCKARTEDTDVRLAAADSQMLDDGGAPVWEWGWVATPSVPSSSYAGPALAPRAADTWAAVRVRDGRGVEPDSSEPVRFETGVLGNELGGAMWTRLSEHTPTGKPAPVQYLRHEFDLTLTSGPGRGSTRPHWVGTSCT